MSQSTITSQKSANRWASLILLMPFGIGAAWYWLPWPFAVAVTITGSIIMLAAFLLLGEYSSEKRAADAVAEAEKARRQRP